MSLSDRRSVLVGLLGLAALPACRMQAARGAGSPAAALFGQIEVQAPRTPATFFMTQYLEERLGRGASGAPYTLEYGLEFGSSGLGTDRDGVTQRTHLTGSARYALKRRGEEGALAQGRVHNFTGYSTTANTVSTAAAREDAERRLIVILADDIVERLLLESPDFAL